MAQASDAPHPIEYASSILDGALLTIELALLSLLIAVLLGMLAALGKLSRNLLARWLASVYTTVIRGIPELVLMFLVFYGGQLLINDLAASIGYDDYIDIDPFISGVITIGFIYGAYMGETFRGAILAVDQGQLEAGSAYGMTRWQVFHRILFPQMMRHALPGLGNNWLVLLKATALVSLIGLEDMVRKAHLASGSTQEPFIFFLAVAVIFLIFTSISVALLQWAENHYGACVKRETH
ncbi:ABC transporter permease [Endozoicomonas sp. SM1973]|uniref:ABC transporter permease n=1 Tax=Spartinivicinus marinus TaxID=2994442 RepID=A0A853HU41_9GAMM|nr:ABC transporter permease [Spartinivicinus marinus]MCX4029963.1 ABC transporter permease [Spartinivicinus marinus]NYZ64793.1 ABC transporter permease [Spartinivicinus marinus]